MLRPYMFSTDKNGNDKKHYCLFICAAFVFMRLIE